jgi:hypothetical protein
MIVGLAIVLTLSLCSTAWAIGAPANPVIGAAAQRSAPAATPAVSSDDGLGAFIIVLISIAGALTLGGAAYTTMRIVHHGHAAS